MTETVWAEESGMRVQVASDNGTVTLTVSETQDGLEFATKATATIARWRWDRLCAAAALRPEGRGQ